MAQVNESTVIKLLGAQSWGRILRRLLKIRQWARRQKTRRRNARKTLVYIMRHKIVRPQGRAVVKQKGRRRQSRVRRSQFIRWIDLQVKRSFRRRKICRRKERRNGRARRKIRRAGRYILGVGNLWTRLLSTKSGRVQVKSA